MQAGSYGQAPSVRRAASVLLSGRIVYGAAIVGFGTLCVVFGDFVHQLQPVNLFLPESTPGLGVLARLNGIVLIAAGLAIVAGWHRHHAALGLAVFLALWVLLLQVPSAFVDPSLLRSPWWVRTFETVALSGAALILAGHAGLAAGPDRDRWIRAGRILFGVSLPVFGVLHFVYADNVASLVPSGYPWPLFFAYLTGAGNLAAGVAIASGVLARPAALLTALQYGVYAVTLHIPRQLVHQPPSDRAGWTSMFVAIGFCGAAMIVAGSLTEGDRVVAASE